MGIIGSVERGHGQMALELLKHDVVPVLTTHADRDFVEEVSRA